MNEQQITQLALKYNFNVQYFESTDTCFIYGMIDNWRIKYIPNAKIPYILYHQCRSYCNDKYHRQGYKMKLEHCFDSIFTHKNLYSSIKRQNNISFAT